MFRCTLVGGNYANTLKAGLWYWNFNEASSNAWTNIGARLLNLFFGTWCVRVPFIAYVLALVGGNWNNTGRAGLWYWWFNESSSNANANIGARLIIWDLMCLGHFRLVDTLVGGDYPTGVNAGLWYWAVNIVSSNTNPNFGARLIIFKIHIKGFGVFGTGVYLYISFSSCRR